jgi:hypothetical protein
LWPVPSSNPNPSFLTRNLLLVFPEPYCIVVQKL